MRVLPCAPAFPYRHFCPCSLCLLPVHGPRALYCFPRCRRFPELLQRHGSTQDQPQPRCLPSAPRSRSSPLPARRHRFAPEGPGAPKAGRDPQLVANVARRPSSTLTAPAQNQSAVAGGRPGGEERRGSCAAASIYRRGLKERTEMGKGSTRRAVLQIPAHTEAFASLPAEALKARLGRASSNLV